MITGVILGLERAAGETAPILFTGATFFLPRLPHSPFDATMALPYHLFVISTQIPGMPIQIQYGTVLVLLVFVLNHECDCNFHPVAGESQAALVMVKKMEKICIENLNVRYADGNESLRNINLSLEANKISVLFGPSGGGKSTLLRTLNRLNDLADGQQTSGKVLFNGEDILSESINVIKLRRKVGMVFSRPVALPLSIYDNVVYGLMMAGEKNRKVLDAAVEKALTQAYVWEEVYDRLKDPAHALSGGQQQRVCLARVLAQEPEVILLDEPTSALDPVSTAKIEQTLQELKKEFTIILVPHNTQQAARVADFAAFFLQGELIETGEGEQLFAFPKDKRTEEYIEGRFG